ncbi:MAG: hypothetical protein Q8914_13945, partial [Bacteroidota bacterium]|nr:hypothetical protein [Bacteroidota bacterium]
KRGIGYFIAEDAVEKVVEDKKEEFFKNILPKLFRMMKLLKLTPETIQQRFEEYLKETPADNPETNIPKELL